ncbi:enoyl-CoA hydratase/carnithine racemase [Amycolatopsis endophytica]|uniref:Enoyl-CoA hydratase/carnithine racemase n=1 Tax=Amycolatopsis endophytica TaxID=860233 RepID=A0A853BAJ5_9PSEU|nr:enoyl-CoA hydratase/carnithine racemase [Amycolatopsis endophytica]
MIASDTAVFGQPEIKLGILPGLGGTQRLTRAIGKAKAMDLCSTGRNLTADAAKRAGPVSRAVKQAVNDVFETALSDGIRYERELFFSRFGTHDQQEGMTAVLDSAPRDSPTAEAAATNQAGGHAPGPVRPRVDEHGHYASIPRVVGHTRTTVAAASSSELRVTVAW